MNWGDGGGPGMLGGWEVCWRPHVVDEGRLIRKPCCLNGKIGDTNSEI